MPAEPVVVLKIGALHVVPSVEVVMVYDLPAAVFRYIAGYKNNFRPGSFYGFYGF